MELTNLIKRAKRGDGEAFVNAIKQYESVLYNVAKRLLVSDEDVADAMQEAIMSAFENIKNLNNEKYFKTWVCKILINKCNEVLRKNKKLIYVAEVLPDKKSSNDFLKIELDDALNSLNKEYKIVMILYYILGLNIREIGEFLMEPEGTVKSRLSRARTILREKCFYEEEAFINGR
ncbi:MAG: sigma-70 family RNA polymerase sigma factor [Bacillota bacterium]|nr:sigma-70 family RNA polymerase sigma factor [Bacillota bacterium]